MNPVRIGIVGARFAAGLHASNYRPLLGTKATLAVVLAYAPDGRAWGDEYLTEKVETRGGWQFPSPEEDWIRGFPQELEDFVDAIREGRAPLSDAGLAREVVEVVYAWYLSAASGRRVDLARS